MDNYLKLTAKKGLDQFDCRILKLTMFKEGALFDSIECCSGAPGKQFFRTGLEHNLGNMEPMPEGHWKINDTFLEYVDNYHKNNIINNVNIPLTAPLDYVDIHVMRRIMINIHLDHNSEFTLKTGYSLKIYNQLGYEKLINWIREKKPHSFYVDWKLGTCPQPLPIAA